ncbi:MAG: glycosyltransferase family 4 protein [Thermodesulfobacteriota bacterium]
MNKAVVAISNHAAMIGGGEYSFCDLLSKLPPEWIPTAVLPDNGELEDCLRKNGIHTVVVPLPPVRPWKIHTVLYSAWKLLKVCRDTHPLIIYANGSRAALYSGIVGSILNLPVIWHCRVAEKELMDLLLTKLCTRIVANSRATAIRFSGRRSAKVRVVYNGLDLEWLSSPEVEWPFRVPKDWKIILVVARASRWKRHDIVLSAFERVAQEDPRIHLVCLGAKDENEPDWWDELQKRHRESKFSEQIHWEGHCEDVRPWYRAATLLALASDNEPFGRVVVEAMANSLPVVAMESGGVPEIVRHGKDGFLGTPGCSRSMADAFFRLLSDEGLRERMGKSAKQRASDFSIERHIDHMAQLFAETVKSKQGAVGG